MIEYNYFKQILTLHEQGKTNKDIAKKTTPGLPIF